MRNLAQLLSLPPSLLLLISHAFPASSQQWPYNLPPHVKYFPEDEPKVKRNVEAMGQLAVQKPVGVRKMSDDEGEMFFPDYWQFDPRETTLKRRALPNPPITGEYTNTSAQSPMLLPPVLPHSDSDSDLGVLAPARYLLPRSLFARDFSCPAGTSSCNSINRPNACCGSSESCIIVPDTGVGDVGCCPAGVRCTGGAIGCNTAAGYSSCPGSGNGGCCLPGYQCFGVGCKVIPISVAISNG